MVFGYRETLISGSRDDSEGVSAFINELVDWMPALGWTLVDDRRDQPASAVAADAHKVVFSSNGEGGNYPTFYMTVFSGTAANQDSDRVAFSMHTAYDVGTHDIPASGVVAGIERELNNIFFIESQSFDTPVWMSGDSEGLVFISYNGSAYDSMMVGRANAFNPVEYDPFPLYINASSSQALITDGSTNFRLVAGNPPKGGFVAGQCEAFDYNFTNISQPYRGISGADSIFIAVPLMGAIRANTNPDTKGWVGTLRNVWISGASTTGMLDEARLTASGIGGVQTYRAFTSTAWSVVIRES